MARHVASCTGESLAIQFTVGEIKVSSKELAPILVEEDATKPEKESKPKKTEVDLMIKTLRKDAEIGRNTVLRERLMPMMLSVQNHRNWLTSKKWLFNQEPEIGSRHPVVTAQACRSDVPSGDRKSVV